MDHPFDALSEEALRERTSVKWNHFPQEVLPCWVADMDFPVAREIRERIADFASAGDLGYPPKGGLPGLREAVADRLTERHALAVEPDQIKVLAGVIPGLNLACRALAGPGEGVVVQPPIYPPFMGAIKASGRQAVWNPMVEGTAGWELDLDGLEEAIEPSTRLLMLCNPQNPTGRVFRRDELERLAEIVLRHRLWVVSDELHADLALFGRHIPFASLDPEVAQRTLTLYGPTKAFNIAGLKIGFAFSANRELLAAVDRAGRGMVVAGNVLAQVAAIAAYRDAGGWLGDTSDYLRANRDELVDFIRLRLPGVRLNPPEGTYLAWLDLRDCDLPVPAAQFLLENAKVGLNAGGDFGPEGERSYDGFARLNFATSRALLLAALGRMRSALTAAT